MSTDSEGEGVVHVPDDETDAELRRQFIRIERDKMACRIPVCTVRWRGPAEPVFAWVPARRLPAQSGDAALEEEVTRLLADERFFAVCVECGQRTPVGFMDDGRICHGCLSAHHGVVF